MNLCGDELSSIRNNGKHPRCELEYGHEGKHEINRPMLSASWYYSAGHVTISNYRSGRILINDE